MAQDHFRTLLIPKGVQTFSKSENVWRLVLGKIILAVTAFAGNAFRVKSLVEGPGQNALVLMRISAVPYT